TGTSVTKATEAIETARRLNTLPTVAEAARAGRLSAAQTAAIADAATVAPHAESRLVAHAADRSLAELLDTCARTKATATDAEERRRAIHATRSLRSWGDAEGAGHLHLRDNPEVVAEVMAAVGPVADRLFHQARRAGRREPPEAYRADALLELVRHKASG